MDVGEIMKLYFDNPTKSIAIDRVVENLERYMTDDRVHDKAQADLIILHVYGRHDHVEREVRSIIDSGRQYAIIQYALKSTRNPSPKDWKNIWDDAAVVWSYYELPTPNLYHAPLAASPETFYPTKIKKEFLVGTLGVKECYESECFGEVHLAAFQAVGKVVHVGEKLNENPIVTYYSGLTDEELRQTYNKCKWFATLRRKEGFEIPAIEALLCGVRPIMFDTPIYRQWFDGLAKFIPEKDTTKTVKSLRDLFKGEISRVTPAEIEETKKRFNWEKSIKGFLERCTI